VHDNEQQEPTAVFDADESRQFREAAAAYGETSEVAAIAEREVVDKLRALSEASKEGLAVSEGGLRGWKPMRAGLIAGRMMSLRDAHRAAADAYGDQAEALGQLNKVLCELKEKVEKNDLQG